MIGDANLLVQPILSWRDLRNLCRTSSTTTPSSLGYSGSSFDENEPCHLSEGIFDDAMPCTYSAEDSSAKIADSTCHICNDMFHGCHASSLKTPSQGNLATMGRFKHECYYVHQY
ncbi:hypothetical protein KC19_VG286200 [Ceratodon purpureus]|uniref:Uncharacterized protein n=1 Tax=Ceratodon purpureus TaxID=3225 RepID=A0A8T0HVK2_CERPU|nr:hypothetical protein KC19_VG286200 [Ceratodon purpureus]